LRHLEICSIDPPGCTDIDDALHVRALANGNYEVGVHIADVTHFIRPNAAIDAEAAKRGTTVYLSNRRYALLLCLSQITLPALLHKKLFGCSFLFPHCVRLSLSTNSVDMVPELLSSNLCSLRGGEDRFAFSCIWELTPQAEIVSTEFTKSIIRSRVRLCRLAGGLLPQ